MRDIQFPNLYRWVVAGLVLVLIAPVAAAAQGVAGGGVVAAPRVDAERMLGAVEFLASDALRGRRTGSPGNAEAREFLVGEFRRVGLQPFGTSYTQDFTFTGRRDSVTYQGSNVVGYLKGTREPDRYIVITAHYDHVGVGRPDERGDSIYNGADDNAAGAAAIVALAGYLREHPPAHSVIFVAFDAEEMGLQGARAFVAAPPVPLERIALNLNLDMVSRNDKNELYAVGTYHYPFLKPYVERAAARSGIKLLMGHDHGEVRTDDWTNASDHGAFHARGIPFLYFGVEDHEDYHRPSDEFSRIHPEFYRQAVETILDLFLDLDAKLPVKPEGAK
jgi:Zn-dependent M28 family amino/carboxypeptidase